MTVDEKYVTADEMLSASGLPAEALSRDSRKTFPDGANMRLEIPSVEGPGVLAAVLDEAGKRGVVVNRVSQGSGAMLQSEAELKEMARIGADAGLEISLFIGPREEWGLGAMSRGPGRRGAGRGRTRDASAALRGR